MFSDTGLQRYTAGKGEGPPERASRGRDRTTEGSSTDERGARPLMTGAAHAKERPPVASAVTPENHR